MKYKVIFIQNQNNVLVVVGKKIYKEIKDNKITFKNKQFTLDKTNHSYLELSKFVYFKDFITNKDYIFKDINDVKSKIDSESLDLLFSTKFLKAVVNPLKSEKVSIDWFSLILGIIVGGLIGFMIMLAIYQSKLEELMNITTTTIPFYPTT